MHPMFLCLGCMTGLAAYGFLFIGAIGLNEAAKSDPAPPSQMGPLRRFLSWSSGYGDLLRFLSLWRRHPDRRPLIYWGLGAAGLTVLFLCLAFAKS